VLGPEVRLDSPDGVDDLVGQVGSQGRVGRGDPGELAAGVVQSDLAEEECKVGVSSAHTHVGDGKSLGIVRPRDGADVKERRARDAEEWLASIGITLHVDLSTAGNQSSLRVQPAPGFDETLHAGGEEVGNDIVVGIAIPPGIVHAAILPLVGAADVR